MRLYDEMIALVRRHGPKACLQALSNVLADEFPALGTLASGCWLLSLRNEVNRGERRVQQ
jgi:hypothetical protein